METTLHDIAPYLEQSAALHRHLCPRQILGVRIGLYAGELLGVPVPQVNKRFFAFVETDGCFSDGVSVATGCWLGRRTLRLIDLGKAAATFIDTESERGIRIRPSADARELALKYAPDAPDKWHAQLEAYPIIPLDLLLVARPVTLNLDLRDLISRPGLRVPCSVCGEEVMNGREVTLGGKAVCKSCAGSERYWD